MAKKKKQTGPAVRSRSVLVRIQGGIKNLQQDTERLLSRAGRQASQLISRDQKRALDRLVSQGRRLRVDSEKRIRRVVSGVEPRIERFLSRVEKRAEERIERLVVRLIWRMGLVSQKEIRRLSQRISQLERNARASRSTPHRKTATPTPPSPTNRMSRKSHDSQHNR
jgi:poly(hydroxyalkanoate) granule associated protein phasin